MSIDALFGAACVVAAWCGHTAESRALADDIESARKDPGVGLSQKQLAAEMRISFEEFSKQLSGVKPLSAWRLYGMTSAAFRLALLKRQLARFNATVITEQDRVFVQSVARLGRRRMARMLPDVFTERRVG